MSSMNENLLDKIARADFSMETDFKSVLRKRLFESGANKKSGEIWISSGSRNRKRKMIRISDENGNNTAAVQRQCTVAFSVCARVCQYTNPLFYCIFEKVVE